MHCVTFIMVAILIFIFLPITDDFCWNATDNCIIGDVFCNYSSRRHNSPFAYLKSW